MDVMAEFQTWLQNQSQSKYGGQEDDPVGKVLPAQAWGPVFDIKAAMLACVYNASAERQGPWACWPANLAELMNSRWDESSCLNKKLTEEDPKSAPDLHARTCTHTTPTQKDES